MATTIINNYRVPEDPFEMVVNTELAGTTPSNQFTLALNTGTYNYIVDWGDGIVEEYKDSTNRIHTYTTPGIYTIKIRGTLPRVYYNDRNDDKKIIAINKWGRLGLNNSSLRNSFHGLNNLVSLPIYKDRFKDITEFNSAFADCYSLTSFPLIDTSSGTNFGFAWYNCSSLTSFALIDTSSVTNFGNAWQFCSSLTNFPLINTSSGTSFNGTWYGCSSLTNFPDINTSSGTNFAFAWRACTSLTSFPLIDTSRGTDFLLAWYGCTSLTSFPANFFDSWVGIPKASCFQYTWDGCSQLTSQSVENILVSIDTSGQSANAAWTDDQKKIEIDYDVATGGLSTATTNAITSLKNKNWKPFINGVYV